MSPEISERSFEEAIECALLQYGPDACAGDATAVRETPPPYGDTPPGGYRKRKPEDYDRTLCLLPRDVVDFVLATQPKEWKKLEQHHGAAVREQFLKRLAAEIERRGALDVLRNGIKDSGCKFRLAYFRPASGLNEETRRLHAANLFAVVRQVRYSAKNEKSLDLVLFLNGIPIFTAELKNPLNGQDVEDAIRQYKTDRDPREPLLAYGRCLAHFAVDPDLVYVTTQLAGPKTRFLPFNQGKYGGAGNPPVPPTRSGYATAYLWEETWARDSVLDLVRQFIHEVEEEDDKGRKTGKRFLIFPRYQQLDCVRKLVADARSAGRGAALPDPALGRQRQELHHRLARPPARDAARRERPARLRLDRGHHRPARARPPAPDHDAPVRADARRGREHRHHLAPAQGGARVGQDDHRHHAAEVPGDREGDRRAAGQALRADRGRGALVAVGREHEEPQGRAQLRIARRGGSARRPERRRPRKSWRARSSPRWRSAGGCPTSRPSPSRPRRSRRRSSSSARSAPTASSRPSTSTACARRSRRASSSTCSRTTRPTRPTGGCSRRSRTTRATTRRRPSTCSSRSSSCTRTRSARRSRSCVEHFAAKVQGEIGGKAKAMIVTRSRLHAVRYKLAVDKYLAERGYPFKALVAFSGTVQDGGQSYTESGMNGFPEAQTAKTFEQPEYRFLIVANKFQTGFDQPLLHTMYVDKKLGGVNAVQTLSRLNRTHPEKKGTLVLDFANEADEIKAAFEPYYETTLLSEATDPNLLYEIQTRLAGFPVYTEADVEAFAQGLLRPQGDAGPALRGARAGGRALRGAVGGGAARLPRSAHRLRAALRVPRPGADLRRRRSREALRLRAAPAAAPARRPRRAAARGAAEHRHGVVPHPADRQRQDRAGAPARRARPREHQGGLRRRRRRSWRPSRASSPS